MKRFLYVLVQCTWGLPQTLAGAVIYLLYGRGERQSFHGAAATFWKHRSSVSLGAFVFVAGSPYEARERTLVHEYGHTIQSLFLGPLYLFVIGLPSILWAGLPVFEKRRRAKGISYYSLYTERWANYLGENVTGEKSME